MTKCLLSVAIIVAFLFGTMAFAEELEPVQEDVLVIDAEDIGITPIQNLEEEEIEEDVFDESEEVFEESDEAWEEEIEEEETEDFEEETVSPEPQEGMVEGYEEGVYFEPNTFDCEVCGECYTCPDDSHVYEHNVYIDDDNTYIYEEWCTICGHGTETPITEEYELLE